MPTSTNEALEIVEIVGEYLDDSDAKELMARLHEEVGEKTENDSLKVSLQMLNKLYDVPEKKIDKVWPVALAAVVVVHMMVVVINAVAFFVLPFNYPIYVWIPLDSFILIAMFSRSLCPLTRLENYLRRRQGLPSIGGFIGHYILRKFKNFNK